jgi:hypothetical protein
MKILLKWTMAQLLGLWKLIAGTTKMPLRQSELEDELLDTRRIVFAIQPVVTFGLLALIVVCGREFAKGLLWAFACLAVGFLLGFLFGIPKTQRERSQSAKETNDGYRQIVNTNLEEISDWVTKIIVGLGIYQLAKVPGWVSGVGTLFALSVGSDEKNHGVFGGAIVFFVVCGFLLGYLVTRLYLQGALGRADRSAVPDERKKTQSESRNVESAEKAERTGDPVASSPNPQDESGSGTTA